MTAERTADWAERAVAEAAAAEPSPIAAERQVLDRIERARQRRPKIREERITLAHGAGGKATHTLVEALFLDAFRNPALEPLGDGASVSVNGSRLAFTTDSFVVSPLFFPGGDIGDLAVNGTVNDLAVCGARPLYLSAGFILEEGFPVADLSTITASMAAAAARAGVQVVTGDTKVVERGKADGCYINTAGVGALDGHVTLGPQYVQPGDAVIVSGPIGEHGMTIMLARGELDIEANLVSDTAPVSALVTAMLGAAPGTRVIRDATRGGVATVLNEIAAAARLGVVIDESAVPVQPAVTGACELLGIDPLYAACEGRFVTVVAADCAAAALRALQDHPLGTGAREIGRVVADPPGLVLLKTCFGGTRIVDMLVGDPLPRIC
jgi:hydrogenase expression/formation protein HypE